MDVNRLPEPYFHPNGLTIIEKRYLRRDGLGQIAETPKEMLIRVAGQMAEIDETMYGASAAEKDELFIDFYTMMAQGEFLPNSPTLMNSGTKQGQLAACFVLPVEDDLDGIFETLKQTALVHKSGGGTGFDFSTLRPKNDVVATTGGEASGPISFMRIFNAATEEVKQGGKRRGANMGILRIDHPDILDFIACKDDTHQLNNFNISVAITNGFMKAVETGDNYEIRHPRTKEVVGQLDAQAVFEKIVYQAWKNGEPGVIFIDEINAHNPTPGLGDMSSTNPCGEQPLLAYESCNLGSINLEKFVVNGLLDKERLGQVVRCAVHFLDNVIDANQYPLEAIESISRANRKIGLGIMGWANALIRMGIPYNTEEAIDTANEVMAFIEQQAKKASQDLAINRGSFANHDQSIYTIPMRNATVTTIAPTGTISMIANTSSGVEPLFGVVYQSLRADQQFIEVNALFEELAKEQGFWDEQLPQRILKAGTLQGVAGVPEHIQRLFVTAGEMQAQWHIRMQAAFQAHCDNAVSKTINFSHEATVDDIKSAYLLAYNLKCKGLTVYRDGSRELQVLNKGDKIVADPLPKTAIRPQVRPKTMAGLSTNYVSACSNFYVTVNGHEGIPFEVFCNSVGQGGCQAQIAAVATLTTLLLRSGVATDEITKRLSRIQCPACIRKEGLDVPSCPAAIGRAIEQYLVQLRGEEHFEEKRNPQEAKCPECGSPLVFQEGCRACTNQSCSYSHCSS